MINRFKAVGFFLLLHVCHMAVAQLESAEAALPAASAVVNAPGNPLLRKAGTTWGAVLNPGADAPLNAFKAFYMNTNRPREVIAQEQVGDVAISYPWDEFHGIKSEDFGAYWVGRMRFKKSQLRLIGINQGHSKTRLIIDGEIVFEGSQSATVPYQFSPGEHLIEVEHLNNWHTTGFKLSFGNHVQMTSVQQVRAVLAGRGSVGEPDAHYIGVYEAKRRDQTVTLDVSALVRDSIIVVSSYEAVKWVFTPANSRHVKAVVVASHSPGSEVAGVNEKRTTVVHYKGMVGSYGLEPSCRCVAGRYHCETQTTLASLNQSVEEISGATLRGFSGSYYGERFAIPDAAVSGAALEQDGLRREADAARRKVCEKKAEPDFESMMNP
jgi:hypothetical protein